jgi:hypothetical protein
MEKTTGITPAMLEAEARGLGMMAGSPAAIVASEKMGQIELTRAANKLPLELRPAREVWERLGFEFGEPIDKLFQRVTFPAGWSIKATEHSMHSDILDEKGRKRGGVFYKAAFYDQRANGSLACRFDIARAGNHYPGAEHLPEGKSQIVLYDGGQIVRFLGAVSDERFPWPDTEEEAAKKWLAERFPNYTDPCAHWDDALPAE